MNGKSKATELCVKLYIMKKILLLEEAAQTALAVYGLYTLHTGIDWWLWPIVFLSPDISMLGYLINTTTGAYSYNLFHHKMVAVVFILAGFAGGNAIVLFVGYLLYGHASFDRMMGYGLKYADSFKHTHLGMLNNKQ